MRLLAEPSRSPRQDRAALLLFGAGAALVLAGAFWPEVRAWLPSCPSQRWLGLPCPGCGLSRACYALLHADLVGATRFNPLWIVLVPYAAYAFADAAAGVAMGRRLLADWPRWFVRGVGAIFVVLWCVLAVVRGITFLVPELNPKGFLLP